MSDNAIIALACCALIIVFSVIIMAAIYWTHCPGGRKRQKGRNRR